MVKEWLRRREGIERGGGGEARRRGMKQKKRRRKDGDKRRSRGKEREGDTIYKTPGKYLGGRKRKYISREYICKTYTLHR